MLLYLKRKKKGTISFYCFSFFFCYRSGLNKYKFVLLLLMRNYYFCRFISLEEKERKNFFATRQRIHCKKIEAFSKYYKNLFQKSILSIFIEKEMPKNQSQSIQKWKKKIKKIDSFHSIFE